MFGWFGGAPSQISAQEVEEQLRGAAKPVIVDVREPEEFKQGHIPGSLLVPLGTLPARLQEFTDDQVIVMVCRSGTRSGMATKMLKKVGLNALNMTGGMNAWRGPIAR